MRVLAMLLLLAPVALGGAIYAARNHSGPVVLMHYQDDQGRGFRTQVWIVRDRGDLLIRANRPDRSWLVQVRRNPRVWLELPEGRAEFEAIVEPHRREHVNELMAETYGWGERLLALFQDRSVSVPVRLGYTD